MGNLFGLPGETHEEIGQSYGFTRSRAQQIEKKALKSMRRKYLYNGIILRV